MPETAATMILSLFPESKHPDVNIGIIMSRDAATRKWNHSEKDPYIRP